MTANTFINNTTLAKKKSYDKQGILKINTDKSKFFVSYIFAKSNMELNV